MNRFILTILIFCHFLVLPGSVCSLASTSASLGGNDKNILENNNEIDSIKSKHMSIANCTCHFITQPLDHFAIGSAGTFQQRYCIYDGYEHNNTKTSDSAAPILFYTGNESPVEEYINSTGFMWELAPEYGALLVFAEHRYEGLSKPRFNLTTTGKNSTINPKCLSYCSSSQALADYASLLSFLNPPSASKMRPVVAFGGSYGGMLAAWMRMKYPHQVVGAMASSAPVWALPLAKPSLDGAWVAVSRAVKLDKSHNDTVAKTLKTVQPSLDESTNTRQDLKEEPKPVGGSWCFHHLLSSFPLIAEFSKSYHGRAILSRSFRLCSPLNSQKELPRLLEWMQSPWFDLAEANFPYASSYVPFALGQGNVKLPAWPVSAACQRGGLHVPKKYGVAVEGNVSEVVFNVTLLSPTRSSLVSKKSTQHTGNNETNSDGFVDNNGFKVLVNWDKVKSAKAYTDSILDEYENATALFEGVREAVAVWFNMSGKVKCFDIAPAPNKDSPSVLQKQRHEARARNDAGQEDPISSTATFTSNSWAFTAKELSGQHLQMGVKPPPFFNPGSTSLLDPLKNDDTPNECNSKIQHSSSWEHITCNEAMNLPIYLARGMGRDFFWPPSHPRNTTVGQVIASTFNETCHDPTARKLYGYPQVADVWSRWLDGLYGGTRVMWSGGASNIVFANGLLDPWSAGGVYGITTKTTGGETDKNSKENIEDDGDHGIVVGNVTQDGSIISITLDEGAHHLDLMWSDADHDPPCAIGARKVQRKEMDKWLSQWEANRQRQVCALGKDGEVGTC